MWGDDDEDAAKDNQEAATAAENVKLAKQKRDARRANNIHAAWENGLWGLLERRLRYLAHAYNVFGYNAERFDMILLCSQLCTLAKEAGRRDVSIHREGSSIRYMKIDSLRICEIKRLLAPGTSLAGLALACNLEINKGIFPFAQFTSLEFLSLPHLPQDAKEWVSDLDPSKAPSQTEVDEQCRFFEEQNFSCIGDFLDFYLNLDCVILHRCIIKMAQMYYKILGLNFIDARKYTVSSFASMGAQIFLARKCRPAMFFPNHQRLYSLLKQSLRGGRYCCCICL